MPNYLQRKIDYRDSREVNRAEGWSKEADDRIIRKLDITAQRHTEIPPSEFLRISPWFLAANASLMFAEGTVCEYATLIHHPISLAGRQRVRAHVAGNTYPEALLIPSIIDFQVRRIAPFPPFVSVSFARICTGHTIIFLQWRKFTFLSTVLD